MGYIYLILSLFCGSLKGYCGKKTSDFASEIKDALNISFVRMLFCIIIGAVVVFLEKDTSFIMDKENLLIAFFSGITCALFVVSWILSVKRGAYMMVDVFLTSGIIIPVLLSYFLFDEKIGITKITGFILLLITTAIMCSYNNNIKKKMTIKSFLILLICGISNGLTDFSQKLYVKNSNGGSAGVFNFYVYLFATVTLLICILTVNIKKEKEKEPTEFLKIMPYIIVMSLCLFFYGFFKTKSAIYLPSAVLYPVSQVGAMIISTFMSVFLFKEKLNKKGTVGIIIAVISLLFLNI